MDRGSESDLNSDFERAGGENDTLGIVGPGGIGGPNDGSQITHHASAAVPGKPMAPIADDPAGTSTDEAQATATPLSEPHPKRGGG